MAGGGGVQKFTTLNKYFSVCLAPRTPYKELIILWTHRTQLPVTVESNITISANNTQTYNLIKMYEVNINRFTKTERKNLFYCEQHLLCVMPQFQINEYGNILNILNTILFPFNLQA
jgi:hypothetical protein